MTTLFEMLSTTPPDWANDVIANWDDVYTRQDAVDMLDFVTHEIFESNASIDMRQVIGQWDHYAGQTWLEAAQNPQYKPGKMRDCFRLYQEKPDYYFNGDVKNGISVSCLNEGPWYSNGGGNHRTVVAKFACEHVHRETGSYPLVQGVAKHYYFVNIEAWELLKRLRQLEISSIHVTPSRKTSNRFCVGSQNTIEYVTTFTVSDYRFGRRPRTEQLNGEEFIRYASHVLRTNSSVPRKDIAKHYWRFWFGDIDNLIY